MTLSQLNGANETKTERSKVSMVKTLIDKP